MACFGDKRPLTGPPGPRAGRLLLRLDPADWSIHRVHHGPFQRPIDVVFHPRDGTLYVLDFGEYEADRSAKAGSGKLWRLKTEEPRN